MVGKQVDHTRPSAHLIIRNPLHLLATGFGSGLSRKAPGTAGSFAALVFFLLVLAHLSVMWQWTFTLIAFVTGIYICGKTAKDWRMPDHECIVWDEWTGQWMVLTALPLTPSGCLAGFLLFRLFDIWKPWPICWADQKLHGGLGIMLDDILAALMAIVVYIALTFLLTTF